MRIRRASLPALLALAALLGACKSPDQPLAPKIGQPQFSQFPGNGPEKITFHSDRTGNVDIFVMNADGSGVTQVTSHPFADLLPLFSPDGSRIVFGRCGDDRCDVVVINPDGSGERTILNDGFPGAWSPDGNQIALSRSDGLWIVNADGTGAHRVAEPYAVTDWSPDGRQLLLGNNDGDDELYVMNLDGSGITKLTDNNAFDGAGTGWSPDGTRIVFHSNRGGAAVDVYVMNADGSGVMRLTPNDGFDYGSPVWSPDGTQIAFESNLAGDEQIFVMNADGSGITQLTFDVGVHNSAPHWIRQVAPAVPPANDDFSNATGISSLPFTAIAQLPLASAEPDEPTPICATFQGQLNQTVWYSFTPTETQSITAQPVNASFSPVVAAYTGNSVGGLTEIGCNVFGGSVTFRAQAGTTYHFLVGGLFGQSGQVEFRLEVTPPPVASFGFFPSDPSIFDAIQFFDQSFDPGGSFIATRAWQFGDGGSSTDCCPTHRYAADGNYTIQLRVTTPDGRTASTSQPVVVRTHDVAITRLQAPGSGMTGKTSRISIDIRSNRYAETVEVQLLKSIPGGFQLVATSRQTLPTRNRVTSVLLSYTFTSADATIGKVTFKAVASLLGARDALPADNEAIAPPTKVTR